MNNLTKSILLKALLCTFFILVCCTITAQIQISGRLINEHKQPVDAVSITCLRQNDSTLVCNALSDEGGRFALAVMQPDRYLLRLSCIGYETQVLRIQNGEGNVKLGDIEMKSNAVSLKEVEVKSESVVRQLDRTMLFPTKEQIQHSFNGYNVLHNLMLDDLDVDPFNRKVERISRKNTGSGIIFCIDGREVDPKEIERLDPKDIRRIDFYDYHPEHPTSDGVIDFIMTKRDSGGLLSSDNLQSLNRIDGKYNISTHLFYRNNEFSAGITDYNKNYTRKKGSLSHYDFHLADGSVLRSREEGYSSHIKDNSIQSYLNYIHTSENARISAGIWMNAEHPKTDQKTVRTYELRELPTLHANERSVSNNIALGGKLSYDNKLNERSKLIISSVFNYGDNSYKRNYSAWNDEQPYNDIVTHINEDFYYSLSQAKYTYSSPNGFVVGFSLNHLQQNTYSTHLRKNTNDEKEKYLFGESSAEITLAKKWKKVMGSFTWNEGLLITTKEHTTNQWMYNGNIMIRYIPNKRHSLNLSLLTKWIQPELKLRTSIDQDIDFMQVKRGNPNLKALKGTILNSSYSWNQSWGTLGINVQGVYVTDNFSIYKYREGDKIIHTYYSGGNSYSIGGNLRSSIRIIPKILTFKSSGGYQYSHTNTWKSATFITWLYSMNLECTYKSWMASARLYSHQIGEKFDLTDGRESSSHYFSIGYSSYGLNITGGVRNPFSHPKYYNSFSSNDYKEVVKTYEDDRMAYITVSYRFRFGKKHKFNDVQHEEINSSAILKASDR